jgi:aryl sulfotransferase
MFKGIVRGMRKGLSRRLAARCYARGVAVPLIHYRSSDEDSGRWLGFRFRPGDIVISSRRRSGTTWMQMICALLIFQTPRLPAPLSELSPWLDHVIEPHDFVYARLDAQPNRRFIKTHTPLAGLPLDPRATFVVAARHPLDMFVSLRHHLDNYGPRVAGTAGPAAPPWSRETTHDSLVRWVAGTDDPGTYPESLPAVLWHLSDAWARRGEPNVLLVRYDDLCADLEGEMRRLAWRLGIAVPEQVWPALAEAATFERMRARADDLAPPPPPWATGDARAFFRRGSPGAGRALLNDEEMAGYYARAARLAPPDMLEWLHR